ncbi:MAG: tRNA lysidine(34) synthetase TilS [Clostridia bacterium]|nr:tRNA lysidine(34) synthetase TilS [Clostridia bacterium]
METDRPALVARVLSELRTRALFSDGQRALVAVSGGLDSMALLHVMLEIREPLQLSVSAAHFEHGIRTDSDEDARFVRAHCEALGIHCRVGHADVPALASLWRTSLEDAARRARYDFLTMAAAECGAGCIVLGHQLEDQAETLLLHLVHGAGLKGLSSMDVVSDGRVRPFLHTPRAELEAYVAERAIPFRDDSTNTDMRYARNYLRHQVFPLLRRLNPRVSEAMARTASIARRADALLDGHTARAIAGRWKRMPYGAFLYLPNLVLSEETARVFCGLAGVPPLDARQTERLVSRAPCNLPNGWRARFSRERLHLLSANGSGPMPPVHENDFSAVSCDPDTDCDGIRTQVFNTDAIVGAEYRYRREGDVFAPLNGPGTQKLKQTLRDAGIDQPFRDCIPVLARGARILWIVGVKPSAEADNRGATRAVRVAYHGDLPWEIEGGGQPAAKEVL